MADSDRTIYVAMGSNFTIAASQFAAAVFTGSASMLAQGIHSLVDTANNGLLLLGRHASHREPDETHPFGYGMEQYFWTLIMALMIFAVGGSFSIYQGVRRLLNPSEIEHPIWNYAVLLVAAISTGYSWVVAFRQLREAHPDLGLIEATRASKNPSDFVVVVEDTAGFLGVAIAFLGIFLSQMLGQSLPDGVASIAVGLVLGAIATFLAYESKKLLVGESADSESVQSVCRLVQDDSAVLQAGPPLTMHLGPEEVLLNLDVQFRQGLSTEDLMNAVDRLEQAIRKQHPEMRRIFLEIERLRQRDGRPTPGPRPDVDRPDHAAEPAAAGRTPADY